MSAAGLTPTDVDGLPVRWLQAGQGYPVALVGGVPGSPGLDRSLLPLTHGRRRAVEATGYGTSIVASAGGDPSPSTPGDSLLRWVDAPGLHTIPDGKHATLEDHPDRITPAINDLLPPRGQEHR